MYQLLHHCYRDAILQWLERIYGVNPDYVRVCLDNLHDEGIVLRDVEIMMFGAILQRWMEYAPNECGMCVRICAALRLTIAWGGKYDDVFTSDYLFDVMDPVVLACHSVNAIDIFITRAAKYCSEIAFWTEAKANDFIRENRVFITVPSCAHAKDLAALFPADR